MMNQEAWLPLTEYAMRTGTSISTLRRKIKSEAINFKMEEGRYLIKLEADWDSNASPSKGFAYEEKTVFQKPQLEVVPEKKIAATSSVKPVESGISEQSIASLIEAELFKQKGQNELYWRALEARVAGLAKKVEQLSENLSEMKMLVKVFEEKVDELR